MIHPTAVDHQLQGKIYMFPNIHFIPSHANKTSADGDIQINETPNCCRSSVGYNTLLYAYPLAGTRIMGGNVEMVIRIFCIRIRIRI